MIIIRDRASAEQIALMLEPLRDYIKVAVDVKRSILAGGHADCQAALLDDGSSQEDVWGADWYPEIDHIELESFINIRPAQINRTQLSKMWKCAGEWKPSCAIGWSPPMCNEAETKERYLRDPVAVRLGNLSSDLARIANLLRIPFCKPVPAVIREAEFFIEWCVGEVDAEMQPQLVAMQVQLARWWLKWPQFEADGRTREQIGEQCREWADWVLAKSGLLGGASR